MNMQLPDFSKYAEKYSPTGFISKISRVAKRAGSKLVYAALVLYYMLESKEVSKKNKALIIAALGYFISPLDIVPDAIPLAGLSDDLSVLIFVLGKVWGEVPQQVKDRAHAKLSTWFDADEIVPADHLFTEDRNEDPV